MTTVAPVRICHQARLRLHTHRVTEFVDITGRLSLLVEEAGMDIGLVHVQTLHTTTGLVINEREPLLFADFESVLARSAPTLGTYAHDDLSKRQGVPPEERMNGFAHCRALLLPSSASINVSRGRLVLGRWQRVLFVELDGPQERNVSVLINGEAAR